MTMPGRPWTLRRLVGVHSASSRFRVAIGSALLLVAVGASACSVHSSSSQGRNLPISVASSIKGVHATKCTLNASNTRVVAAGRFNPSAALPVVNGQQAGALQLYLTVLTTQTFLGHHNVEAGDAYEGISVGQTSWRIAAPIEQGLKLRPTSCVVAYADMP